MLRYFAVIDLEDRIGDYLQSEHFALLDPAVKVDAEVLLHHFLQAAARASDDFPALARPQLFLEVLTGPMAQLDLPLPRQQNLPQLIEGFFDYLAASGAYPEAATWAEWMPGIAAQCQARRRPDGSLRGQTVRHPVQAVGRNEPCPCGSGKKFKKCCMN